MDPALTTALRTLTIKFIGLITTVSFGRRVTTRIIRLGILADSIRRDFTVSRDLLRDTGASRPVCRTRDSVTASVTHRISAIRASTRRRSSRATQPVITPCRFPIALTATDALRTNRENSAQ